MINPRAMIRQYEMEDLADKAWDAASPLYEDAARLFDGLDPTGGPGIWSRYARALSDDDLMIVGIYFMKAVTEMSARENAKILGRQGVFLTRQRTRRGMCKWAAIMIHGRRLLLDSQGVLTTNLPHFRNTLKLLNDGQLSSVLTLTSAARDDALELLKNAGQAHIL